MFFDSDADIVDHQVAIIEYENKAVLSFSHQYESSRRI